MKISQLTLSILVFSGIFCTREASADQSRERQLLDAGWRFQLGDPVDVLTNAAETNVTYYPEISDLAKLTTGEISGASSETNLAAAAPDPLKSHLGENVPAVQTNFNDSAWQSLSLPHDWVVSLPFDSTADMGHGYKLQINGTNSPTTVGWYRHSFVMPASYTGKTISLEFDGVYRNCLAWLNGHILGRNVGGYDSFACDISEYANPGGTNVLVVRVDASRFEGWFYEGAGIYRHVWLVKTDPIHVAHWGTYVTNLVSGTNAAVTLQTQVNNDGATPVTCNLTSTILDPFGNPAAQVSQSVTIGASTNLTVAQAVTVTNAQLWSLTSPLLYTLVSTITQGTTTNDVYQTPFGIRTFKWDPNNGLLLNGQRVELQGMCNHQDHAGVGIAVPDRIQYYRVERLKEMGCNAWRTSHNTPTPELLDACDQLGMLVLDENRRLGVDPETLGELQRHVQRDRNHPSVFAWSLGNEEVYVQGSTTGAAVLQTMQNVAHQIDPSRSCTIAQNGSWGSGFTTVVDVQGYNYRQWGDEDAVHASFPNLPSMVTEEGSTEAARGIYTDTSVYKRNYDNEPTHTYTIEQLWQFYLARPWNAGLCIWTGFDYRGEPTPFSWPNINSQYGPVDTCGFAKDIYYYFQANWTARPVLHLLPHWNWTTNGQIINAWVYSDCDLVEVFLNGASLGRKLNNPQTHLEWNIPYAAGSLQAVGYQNGQPVITNTVTTTGAPVAVALNPDRHTILADGRDVSMVTVSVVDAQGRIVPTATNTVTFNLTGGTIIGLGNGDPIDHESDQPTNNVGLRSVFNGLAQVMVQSSNLPGTMTLTATANGLSSAQTTILVTTNPLPPDAPAGPVTVASGGLVRLSWDVVPGALTYNLKRSTMTGGPYTTIFSNTASLTYADTAVVNGTTYYYVLTAANTNGEGGQSVEVSAAPRIIPPLFVTEPNSFTNAHPIYAGVPANFSALVYGDQPLSYQWYEMAGGVTQAIAGATNATFTYLSPNNDPNGVTGFFVVASNGASNVVSATASLYNTPGQPSLIKTNTTTLNGPGDWLPGLAPSPSYLGQFDSTLSAADASALTLGGNVSLAGLVFLNNLNGPVVIGGGNTLTLDCSGLTGWPGLDLSAANQNVTLNCALTLKGSQAWNVASGRTLTIGGALTTSGAGLDLSSLAGSLAGLGNVNGILGPWATTGSGSALSYATVSEGMVSGYAGGLVATANNMTSATANYTLGSSLSLTANANGNTLSYTGGVQTLTLGADTMSMNGLLNSGSGALTLTGTGYLSPGANQELVVAANSSGINLACPITNNSGGPSGLTYNGTSGGTLTLSPNSGSTTSDNASVFTGNVVINSGTVSVQKQVNVPTGTPVSSPLGDRTLAGRTVTVNSGAILSFDLGNELGRGAGPTFPQMTLVANQGGTIRSTVSNRTLGPLQLNGGALSIANVNGAQYEPFGFSGDVTVGGTSPSAIAAVAGGGVNLTAGAAANAQRTFTVADVTGGAGVDLSVSAILANTSGNTATAAGLIKAGAGTMDLAAANIYTGPTTINGGALLVDGSIGNGSVTVNSGGVLGGRGVITGAVSVSAGGIVEPGLGGSDTSALTIDNTLTVAGNTVLVLNRAGTPNASQITGLSKLTRGGTLTVTNGGVPLQSGDTFTLFNATNYTGNFATTNLPVLAPGLSWTNRLSGNAYILTITGQAVYPTITHVYFGGGNLVFNGANGLAGQPYRVLAATNLAAPMAAWLPVLTNNFAADGSYTNLLPVRQMPGVYFLRLSAP